MPFFVHLLLPHHGNKLLFPEPFQPYLGFAVVLGKVLLKVDSQWYLWICGTYLQWLNCYVELKEMARLKLIHL